MMSEWLREVNRAVWYPRMESCPYAWDWSGRQEYLSEKIAIGKIYLTVAVAVRRCSQCEATQQGEIQGSKYCSAISGRLIISDFSLVEWTVGQMMRKPCDAAYNKSAPRAQSGVEENKEDLERQMENILQRMGQVIPDLISQGKDLGICLSESDGQQRKDVIRFAFVKEGHLCPMSDWELLWRYPRGPRERWWELLLIWGLLHVGRCGKTLEATSLCWFGNGRCGREYERCEV